jgi:hypothetical protein
MLAPRVNSETSGSKCSIGPSQAASVGLLMEVFLRNEVDHLLDDDKTRAAMTKQFGS